LVTGKWQFDLPPFVSPIHLFTYFLIAAHEKGRRYNHVPLRPGKAQLQHASGARFARRQTSTNFSAFAVSKLCRFERKRQKFSAKHYLIAKNNGCSIFELYILPQTSR